MAGSPQVNFLKRCLFIAKWAGVPRPGVCIETGTYQGDGTLALKEQFDAVHTIELSEKWHQFAAQKLAPFKGITCHHGDSAEVLAALLPQLSEPAVFFLDAHFAGGDTARGSEEVPLLRELEAISKRPYADMIIVDDLRLIGKKGQSGAEGDPVYPLMTFDWRDITMERIAGVVNRGNRTFWVSGDDRILIFRNLPAVRAARARIAVILLGLLGKMTSYKNRVRARAGRWLRPPRKQTGNQG
jgi:hypothetical protein